MSQDAFLCEVCLSKFTLRPGFETVKHLLEKLFVHSALVTQNKERNKPKESV